MSLWAAVCLIAIIPTTGLAHGRDFEILERWYGRGVHAYFEGHDARAVRDLSQAIEGGSKDPRVYYFRGLAYLKTGRIDAARADMARGGALETLDVDGAYPVSRSLERVQGAPRQLLERYRRQATMAAFQRQQQRRRRRYEAIRRREPEVLRQQVDLRLDEFARPASQRSVSRAAPPAALQQQAPGGGKGGTAVAAPSPAASQPARQRDPFADDVPAGDTPAVAADGGVTGTLPLDTKPKSGPESSTAGPLGEDGPASPDPSPSAAEGERPAEPADAEKAPAVEKDPFGNDDAAAGSDEDDPFADN